MLLRTLGMPRLPSWLEQLARKSGPVRLYYCLLSMSSQQLCFCVTIIALGICSHGIIVALASLATAASVKHKQNQSRSKNL